MSASERDVETLLPHAGNMVLIDQLQSTTDEGAEAQVKVKNPGFFSAAPDMPAWVGIEYMAQTIAAWAGYQAFCQGEEPRIGFLIGSRKYQSETSHFSAGSHLLVKVEKVFQDANGLASFDCVISDQSGSILVSANLNVFQPNDQQIQEMMEAEK